jgi:hypothetical protein
MMSPEPPAGGPKDKVQQYYMVIEFNKLYQRYLDKTNPFALYRWLATALVGLLFAYRVLAYHGWYLVTYALCIYLLNIFLAFISPKFDPSYESLDNEGDLGEGPSLPRSANEEFRPFVRRLPEFKFWYSATLSILVALFCSFFRIFDIPVFWPILVFYFFILFGMTMRRQIKHMVKYKYVPFDFGKKKYTGK